MTDDFNILLKKIIDKGLDIKVVYDIGACVGNWTILTRMNVLPNAQYVMFEANPTHYESLKKVGVPIIGAVLSSPDKQSVKFYNSNNTNDSYYRDTMTIYDKQTYIEVPCTTVDSLAKEYNLPKPNLVKIDTQGSELDILSGADIIVNNADLILIECPIVQCNYGAPTFTDYMNFFKKHRYIPLDIVQKHIGEDTLVQVDILFMKEQSKEKYLGPNNYFRAFE